jgi:selenocysteine lyase/cysteine desulfurase
MYAGIGAFRIANRRTSRETIALTKRLRDEFRVMTVHRDGAAAGSVIRVSPGIFTRPEQIDRFIDAVKILAAS